MVKVECPSCGEYITIKTEPKIGQFVSCIACKTVLTVTSLSPLTLSRLTSKSAKSTDSEVSGNSHKRKNRQQVTQGFEDEEFDDDEYLERRQKTISDFRQGYKEIDEDTFSKRPRH